MSSIRPDPRLMAETPSVEEDNADEGDSAAEVGGHPAVAPAVEGGEEATVISSGSLPADASAPPAPTVEAPAVVALQASDPAGASAGGVPASPVPAPGPATLQEVPSSAAVAEELSPGSREHSTTVPPEPFGAANFGTAPAVPQDWPAAEAEDDDLALTSEIELEDEEPLELEDELSDEGEGRAYEPSSEASFELAPAEEAEVDATATATDSFPAFEMEPSAEQAGRIDPVPAFEMEPAGTGAPSAADAHAAVPHASAVEEAPADPAPDTVPTFDGAYALPVEPGEDGEAAFDSAFAFDPGEPPPMDNAEDEVELGSLDALGTGDSQVDPSTFGLPADGGQLASSVADPASDPAGWHGPASDGGPADTGGEAVEASFRDLASFESDGAASSSVVMPPGDIGIEGPSTAGATSPSGQEPVALDGPTAEMPIPAAAPDAAAPPFTSGALVTPDGAPAGGMEGGMGTEGQAPSPVWDPSGAPDAPIPSFSAPGEGIEGAVAAHGDPGYPDPGSLGTSEYGATGHGQGAPAVTFDGGADIGGPFADGRAAGGQLADGQYGAPRGDVGFETGAVDASSLAPSSFETGAVDPGALTGAAAPPPAMSASPSIPPAGHFGGGAAEPAALDPAAFDPAAFDPAAGGPEEIGVPSYSSVPPVQGGGSYTGVAGTQGSPEVPLGGSIAADPSTPEPGLSYAAPVDGVPRSFDLPSSDSQHLPSPSFGSPAFDSRPGDPSAAQPAGAGAVEASPWGEQEGGDRVSEGDQAFEEEYGMSPERKTRTGRRFLPVVLLAVVAAAVGAAYLYREPLGSLVGLGGISEPAPSAGAPGGPAPAASTAPPAAVSTSGPGSPATEGSSMPEPGAVQADPGDATESSSEGTDLLALDP
ncbi:MAG: hypothetical protein MI919_27675, partial [Holophagales bacterium]|nr:hypothetical protein [Holophagales bacterium]